MNLRLLSPSIVIQLLAYCYADWDVTEENGGDAQQWENDWDDDDIGDDFSQQLRVELQKAADSKMTS